MDVEFKDPHLRLLLTDQAADTGLPIAIIHSARKKIYFLESAPDEKTLRQWKSLHYEKLQGDREGQRSIRVNLQWRIIFVLDGDRDPPKITILEIGNHYD